MQEFMTWKEKVKSRCVWDWSEGFQCFACRLGAQSTL